MIRELIKSKVVLCVVILSIALAVVICALLLLRADPTIHNGRDYIPQEYGAIELPDSLRFVSKDWDDVHAFDPSLQSIWVYEYDIIKGNSHTKVKDALVTSLQRSKYRIVAQDHNKILDAYHLEATNNNIYLYIEVGYGCPYVHCVGESSAEKVFTSAALPDKDP